jgi:hypothetical protein
MGALLALSSSVITRTSDWETLSPCSLGKAQLANAEASTTSIAALSLGWVYPWVRPFVQFPLVFVPQFAEARLTRTDFASQCFQFGHDGLAAGLDAGLIRLGLLDQADHALAMARQHDFLALFHGANQFGQLALGLVDGNGLHDSGLFLLKLSQILAQTTKKGQKLLALF